MLRPNSDFTNIKESGKACVGCGKTRDVVELKRLRTYSVSYACFECLTKHVSCAYVNPAGEICNHAPHPRGPCKQCACVFYQHPLETEYDRQLASCVGKAPTSHVCRGFANRTCTNTVLMTVDGEVPPLCSTCEKEWRQGIEETAREAKKILGLERDANFLADADVDMDMPN